MSLKEKIFAFVFIPVFIGTMTLLTINEINLQYETVELYYIDGSKDTIRVKDPHIEPNDGISYFKGREYRIANVIRFRRIR